MQSDLLPTFEESSTPLAALRPLRGGCQCGRNRYIIAIPQDGLEEAQVLFNTEPEHRTWGVNQFIFSIALAHGGVITSM